MQKNFGVSLISLIIVIIVVILLAAIVVFSGMDTPKNAQFSKFVNDVDSVQTSADDSYYAYYTEKSVMGEVWTKSQYYEAVATGETDRNNLSGIGIVAISEEGMMKINLPNYEGRSWGIALEDLDATTKIGSVVITPGFEVDGKIYCTLLDIQNGGRDSQPTWGMQTRIVVKNFKVTTDVEGKTEAKKEITDGTDLYINFDATENGKSVTVTPSLPLKITTNGNYKFTLTNQDGESREYVATVQNYKVLPISEIVKVGDYIEYSGDGQSCTVGNDETGYTSSQSIEVEQKIWRVLSVNKETGEVLITTDGATNEEIFLAGAKGFLKGIDTLNKICKELYSNNTFGTEARSMTIADVYNLCGKNLNDISFARYAYCLAGDDQTPNEVIKESGTKITYTKRALTNFGFGPFLYSSDEGGKTSKDFASIDCKVPELGNPVLLTLKEYNCNLTSKAQEILGTKEGWIATQYIKDDSSYVKFDILRIDSNSTTYDFLGSSLGAQGTKQAGLHPVVSLGNNLRIYNVALENGGSTLENAWKIEKKY